MKNAFVFLLSISGLTGCRYGDVTMINENDFVQIMKSISNGWNDGNAQQAIQFFDDNAVYEEPPAHQLYRGKQEIYEFFGGDHGFDIPMSMEWHNMAFNEEDQIGFGEYTFKMNNRYHGIVIMQFKNGKIIKWREYQYTSTADWEEFAKESRFKTF